MPLNLSEYLEAQVKSKACLSLLQIKPTPALRLKAGDSVYLFHHRPPLQRSPIQHSKTSTTLHKQSVTSKAAAQAVWFNMMDSLTQKRKREKDEIRTGIRELGAKGIRVIISADLGVRGVFYASD